MILDKIENSKLYMNLHPQFAKAFEFILNTDFSELKDGRYEIDGSTIFALVQQYQTKNSENAKLETHFKYIDIQYIISGTEQIGIAPLNNHNPDRKDIENDIAFYKGKASFIKLEAGMFAIFFPHDMHMPGIMIEKPDVVRKVVIKVKK